MFFSSALDHLQGFGPNFVYLAIYVLLLLSAMGMPLPEDLTLVATGYLIHLQLAHPLPAVAVGILGILTGDQFVYTLGRHFGPRIVRHHWFSKILSVERYDWIQRKFDRFGAKLVFFARFVSGLRGAVFLAAGILQMPRGRFLLFDLAGAAISVPLFILLGLLFGPHLESLLLHLSRARNTVLLLIALTAIFFALRSLARRRYGIGDDSPRGE